MGQIKTRLAALLLALVMLLSGCGESTGESSANSPPPAESGTPSEISKEPGLSGSSSESQDELSAEEKRLIARMGLEEAETRELTGEHMNEIKESVASMRAAYVAGPGGKDPLVEERDWSVYTSGIGEENLSNQEAVLYRRLDKLCLSYLESSALSGVKCQFSNGNVWDVTDTVSYGDLGLSSEQAKRVAYWFKWNHPQYYFIGNGSATYSSNSEICLRMYHLMVNGEKRAKITNQLFDKLDGWIEDVNSRASTTYEKELLANKLLCEQNIYERQYENPPDGGLPYDQSLYSVVLLGKTVCAGYALGFCAMMNAMNIETTVALSITHAWNVVRFDDGNHYAVDVCWNDTDSTPAYVNKYLNIGERIMSETNSRRESHTYEKPYDAWIPAIAKESYNPEEDDSQQASDGLRNLRIQESSSTSVTLAWDEAAGSHMNHSHQFEAAVFTDTSRSKTLYVRKPSETFFTFEPLNPNTSYEFGIRLCCSEDDYTTEWTCLTVTTADGEPEKLTTLPRNIETVYQKKKGLYVACGSLNPITKNQMEYACSNGFKRINLSAKQKLSLEYYDTNEGQEFLKQLQNICECHNCVIVDTFDTEQNQTQYFAEQRGMSREDVRFAIAKCHGNIVKYLITKGMDYTIFMTGGDTLMGLMKVLDNPELTPVCEISQGVVLSILKWNEQKLQIISKSGGFGNADVFVETAKKLIHVESLA